MATWITVGALAEAAVKQNKMDIQNDTLIPSLETELREINKGINNLVKLAEKGIISDTVTDRLQQLEREKRVVERRLVEASDDIIILEKEHIVWWLTRFLDGDINDEEYRRSLIDLFVNSVTVWDEPDMFIQQGYSYFDTAAGYHDTFSETAFRKAVSERYHRDKYIIADKLSFWEVKKEEEMQPFFEERLEKLGVDYIDVYLLHGINTAFYELAEKIHAFDFVIKLKEQSRVGKIGMSFHGSAQMLEKILIKYPQLEVVQLQLNYLDWEDSIIQSRLCYETCVKYNKEIYVMEPVKGGSLVRLPEKAAELLATADKDKTPAQWALEFVAGLEHVSIVLSGMSSAEQMKENLRTFKNISKLSAKQLETLAKVADIIRRDTEIACTACRYCMKECPKQIPIADYFTLYNSIRKTPWNSTALYYQALSENKGKACDCIECGLCEQSCPQHIEIRNCLKAVSKVFDEDN